MLTVYVCVAQCQYLTLLSVELHVTSRSDLRPDPEFDEIRAVFYCLHIDQPVTATDTVGPTVSRDIDTNGVIAVSRDKLRLLNVTGVGGDLTVTYVNTEIDLLSELTSLVIQYVLLLLLLLLLALLVLIVLLLLLVLFIQLLQSQFKTWHCCFRLFYLPRLLYGFFVNEPPESRHCTLAVKLLTSN